MAIFGNRYERFLANSGFGIFTDLRCVRFCQFSRSVNVGIVRDTTFGTLSPTCVLWSVISLSTGRNLDDVVLSIDSCVWFRQFSRSVNVGIVHDTTFGTLSPTCISWAVTSLSTGKNLDYAVVRFSPVQPFFLFLKVNPQFNFFGGTIWKLQKSRLQGQTAQDSLQT